MSLQGALEERLAALGTVPWVIGGGWNASPEEVQAAWRRPAVVVHTDQPTQKFGGNFDWYMHSPRLQLDLPQAEVVPGTDHVGVSVQLPGNLHKMLGYRLIQPAPLSVDALAKLRELEVQQRLAALLGSPPVHWGEWCEKGGGSPAPGGGPTA